jgi:hypothetical protein
LGVFALLGGPLLAFQLAGPLPQTGSPFTVSYFGIDLANHVVPTPQQLFTTDAATARAQRFSGGPEEHGGFLGWPLVAVAAAALVICWRRERVRVPLLVALVVAVLALGQELRIDGRRTGVALPWNWLAGLPGFEHVIPSRLALFTAGLVGAGLAFALTSLRETAWSERAFATVIVAIALLPLTPARLPAVEAPSVPAFFTSPDARMCPGGSVLVLPFPAPDTTAPVQWQAASDMAFAMPGGWSSARPTTGAPTSAGSPPAPAPRCARCRLTARCAQTPGMAAAFRSTCGTRGRARRCWPVAARRRCARSGRGAHRPPAGGRRRRVGWRDLDG